MTFDPRRHALPLAALWWLALIVAVLAVRPPTPVDETRYLSVAWAMAQSGDWLTLRLNGAPYGHKPPLLFWLVNLGWSVTGPNVWWPRLLLAGFALGSLVLVQRLARRLAHGDETVAAMALLITASSLYWAGFTGAVMFDVMLVFFVLAAVNAVEWAASGGGWHAWLLAGAALGAGILTKGPVALLHVLPLALLAPWWLGTRSAGWRGWYAGIGLAVAVAAAIALAWAIPAALAAGGGFGREIFWSQSADRIVATTHHRRPFWFYLPGIAVLTAPWLLWPSLWRGLAALRHAAEPGVRFALAWCLLPVLAFSAFAGKQIQYLLPLLPAMAYLAACGLAAVPTRSRWALAVPALAAVVLAATLLVFAGMPRGAAVLGAQPLVPVAITVAGLLLAAAVAARAPLAHPTTTVAAIGCAATIGVLGALVGVGHAYLAPRDLQPVATALARAQAAGQPVAHFGKYHGEYHFVGRLQQPIEVVHELDALYRWAEANPQGRVVVQSYAPMVHRDGRAPLVSQPFQGRQVSVWRGADLAGIERNWKRGRDDDADG